MLYLLNLCATVLSYWLFAYKTSLLQAHQRSDVVSKVMLLTNTVMYAVQIAVIVAIKDYYLYVIVTLAAQALTNIAGAVCATKLYPHLKPVGSLSKAQIALINQRIKDLFTSKMGGAVFGAGSTLVISAFRYECKQHCGCCFFSMHGGYRQQYNHGNKGEEFPRFRHIYFYIDLGYRILRMLCSRLVPALHGTLGREGLDARVLCSCVFYSLLFHIQHDLDALHV